jgi:hypothetical protein
MEGKKDGRKEVVQGEREKSERNKKQRKKIMSEIKSVKCKNTLMQNKRRKVRKRK